MAILIPVCQPCANGDHRSHDDHQGFGGHDMLDCKATSDDGLLQCMCRATWPTDDTPFDPMTIPPLPVPDPPSEGYVCPCCKCETNGGGRLDACHCDYGDCPNCKETP